LKTGGAQVGEDGDLRVPADEGVARLLSSSPSGTGLLVGGADGVRLLPVDVVVHGPDLLGPRFIDELHPDHVARHAVPGPDHDGWTREALAEVAELLCDEPFARDPVASIAEGDDWVGLMARAVLLAQPAPADSALRAGMVNDLQGTQESDGSWGGVAPTAYAVLRLLALGAPPDGAAVRRACEWLLAQPEPPPRPGMWMLTRQYLDEWTSRRKADARCEWAPCEVQWTGPDDDINYFSWQMFEAEQDHFRSQEAQTAVPICARHHPPACEPRMTHVSGVVAEALLRCGHADHPRMRRYLNTAFHLGGEWGYWCGCGALGYFDRDVPPSEDEPDFSRRSATPDGSCDVAPWRWVDGPGGVARLSGNAGPMEWQERGTHLLPFQWLAAPGADGAFALVGSGWQNGDCWLKTNRALSQHPSWPGSVQERLGVYQASRYQTSLGRWEQAFPAGMLAFLVLCSDPAAESLVIKTVPWLRNHQGDDGLWHQEDLWRDDWGKLATPAEPRLATWHICAALRRFGLLERLRAEG
jgi:hypothetical protein